MQQAFARYGYNIPTNGKFDGPTMEVVTAFQRHFRQERVDGIVDRSTMTTLHALLESLPPEATATVVAEKSGTDSTTTLETPSPERGRSGWGSSTRTGVRGER